MPSSDSETDINTEFPPNALNVIQCDGATCQSIIVPDAHGVVVKSFDVVQSTPGVNCIDIPDATDGTKLCALVSSSSVEVDKPDQDVTVNASAPTAIARCTKIGIQTKKNGKKGSDLYECQALDGVAPYTGNSSILAMARQEAQKLSPNLFNAMARFM